MCEYINNEIICMLKLVIRIKARPEKKPLLICTCFICLLLNISRLHESHVHITNRFDSMNFYFFFQSIWMLNARNVVHVHVNESVRQKSVSLKSMIENSNSARTKMCLKCAKFMLLFLFSASSKLPFLDGKLVRLLKWVNEWVCMLLLYLCVCYTFFH